MAKKQNEKGSKKRKGGGLPFDPAPFQSGPSFKKFAIDRPDDDIALATRLQVEEYDNLLGKEVFSPVRESKGGLTDTPEATTTTVGNDNSHTPPTAAANDNSHATPSPPATTPQGENGKEGFPNGAKGIMKQKQNEFWQEDNDIGFLGGGTRDDNDGDKPVCRICNTMESTQFSKTQKNKFFRRGEARCTPCIEQDKKPVEKGDEAEKNSKGDPDSVSVGSVIVAITDSKKRPICNSCGQPIWMYKLGNEQEPGCDCGNVQMSRMVSILDEQGVSLPQFLGISAEILSNTIGPERKALRERFLELSLTPLGKCHDSYIELMTKRGGLPTGIAEHMWDLFGRNIAPPAKVFVDKIADGRAQLDHIEHLIGCFVNRLFGRVENKDDGSERSSEPEDEKKEGE